MKYSSGYGGWFNGKSSEAVTAILRKERQILLDVIAIAGEYSAPTSTHIVNYNFTNSPGLDPFCKYPPLTSPPSCIAYLIK
jgi:hypothetical protein